MADNVTANPGAGGATFAADDIGGILHPRTKVEFGDDGNATDVSVNNPLPINASQLDAMLYYLAAILEKMPRLDSADRIVTSSSEVVAPMYYSGTYNNVTGAVYQHVSMPWNLSDAGTNRIYDNIKVS